MAVKLGNALASVQGETGFNTYVCIRKLADGLGATADTLSTIISNNVVTNEFITIVGDAAAADPTASVGLTVVDGTASTLMRSDAAPPLSQAISPTMTGTWNFTPSADAVPVTINAPTSADMQRWDPTSSLNTVITDSGDLGVGDATPTANVSIQARSGGDGNNYDYTTILNIPNLYAWWDAGDIWGDLTNNAAGNGHGAVADNTKLISGDGYNWIDKTGNGHNLSEATGGAPLLHKGCGPNGKDAIAMHTVVTPTLNTQAWSNPWAGTAFGDPATWTVVSLAYVELSGGYGLVSAEKPGGDPSSYGSVVRMPSGGSSTLYQARYVFGTDPVSPGKYTKNKTTGTHTGLTGTIHGGSGWHLFVWRSNGGTSQNAWIDRDTLADVSDAGDTTLAGRSAFTHVNRNGTDSLSNPDHMLELMLFDRALTDAELDTVYNHLANKYDTAFVPIVSQPLLDLKKADGTIDSIVDASLNVGLGTATPTEKLHVVGQINIEDPTSGVLATLSAADLAGDTTFFFVDPLPAAVTAYGGGFVTTGIGTEFALACFGPTETDISVAGGFALRTTPRLTFNDTILGGGHGGLFTAKAEQLLVTSLGTAGVGAGLYFDVLGNPSGRVTAHILMENSANVPTVHYRSMSAGGNHVFEGGSTGPIVEIKGPVKATALIQGLVQSFSPPNTSDIGVLSGVGEDGTDPGGDIYIIGGGGSEPGGGADGGRGANIVITPGPGGHNKNGGNFTLTNGAAGSGTGLPGAITVGSFSDDGAGTVLVQPSVSPAAITIAAYDGGALTLASAALGGAATLQAGADGTTTILGGAGVIGGPVIVTGGMGAGNSGYPSPGGPVTITGGGLSGVYDDGGTVSLIGGAGGTHTGDVGGSVHLEPGTGNVPGTIDMVRAGAGAALRWDLGSVTGSWTITVPDHGSAGTLALASDVAYDATTWNSSLDCPTKNAVRDKFETLGTLSTQNGTFSGTSSGTNTGDQTIQLTGDVTGSGVGTFAATIANDAVTYAKVQNVSATDLLLGRSTAGAGDVEEIACTAAGRALIDDATAAAQRTTLGATYTLPFGVSLNQNPASATTYFLGPIQKSLIANSTTSARNKTYFRRAGVIRVADVFTLSIGTAGSNEAWSIYVRINDTTDTLIATVSTTGPERNFTNTAIDITVAAGDFFEIKMVDPTWATPPTLIMISGYLLVE